jgi:predicted nucleotidyltransferase component of viral defense system
MKIPDRKQFEDAAEILGIPNPSVIEKDFHVVQLLDLLKGFDSPHFGLVFCGGTCIAKTCVNIKRMSEDIDIKVVLKTNGSEIGRSQQRNLLRQLHIDISNLIKESKLFSLENSEKHNESRNQVFQVKYSRGFKDDLLRPELKLEFTLSSLYQEPSEASISSLFSEASKGNPEISSFPCASFESTAAEKIVCLLRRTASAAGSPDPTLVRHLYDLYILKDRCDLEVVLEILLKVIEEDATQFAGQDPAFSKEPYKVLAEGFRILSEDNSNVHSIAYQRFLDELVYHPSPPSWSDVIQNLSEIIKELLP